MIVTDHQPCRVSVAVYGEFTLQDYKEFEELLNYKIKFEGPVDLLFDLRQMAEITLDVAWEELKSSREHSNDFRRIAVISDSHWISWSAWLSLAFIEAEVRLFETPESAAAWLDEEVINPV